MAAFALKQQGWIIATETEPMWPAVPQLFLIWPFTDSVPTPDVDIGGLALFWNG